MGSKVFDEHAAEYDGWFLKNENVLRSEAALVARALGSPGRTLSVGCGSGLFEMILKKEFGITIEEGIEPSEGMAAIARKRGLKTIPSTAEEMAVEPGIYDTVMFNGSPGYIDNLGRAFANARRALKPGGRIVVLDVPKESSYALLYNLGCRVGDWDDPVFTGARPRDVYPMEFVVSARWRTTPEKVALLEAAGFGGVTFFQTLTRHPVYTNESVEEPSEGFDRGDYVAIVASAPRA
jgi:SAM-dependent methyltransferase